MTREEAREELIEEWNEFIDGCGLRGIEEKEVKRNPDFKKVYEANLMAIQALEQEPSGDLINRQDAIKAIDEKAKRIKNEDTLNGLAGAVGILFDLPSYNSINSELSGDAVSRQAVLETLDDMDNVLDEDRTIENYKELLKECYEVLPPVKPQEKMGHWIYKTMEGQFCSICGEQSVWKFNYCPNCGAKMVEEQERSE